MNDRGDAEVEGGDAWHLIVIGVGPAGTVAATCAARALAAAGREPRVLLVDKARFPRDKVCGCCLNAAALATLARCGLGAVVRGLGGVTTERLDMLSRGGSASLRLPRGLAVSRGTLDAALAGAAMETGVRFEHETVATLEVSDAGRPRVRLSTTGGGGERVVQAEAVLVADGLGGTALGGLSDMRPTAHPRGRLGVATLLAADAASVEPGRIVMCCGRFGYVGLVQVEGGRVDIAAALDADAVKRVGGIAAAVWATLCEAAGEPARPRARLRAALDLKDPQQIGLGTSRLAEECDASGTGLGTSRLAGTSLAGGGARVCRDAIEAARWRGVGRLTRRRPLAAGPRVLVVGDAAGYVEPFTGEGMAWATAGGEVAGQLLAEAVLTDRWDAVAAAWERAYRERVRRRQWACRAAAWGLRRPAAVRAAVAVLSLWPGAGERVAARVAEPRPGAATGGVA